MFGVGTKGKVLFQQQWQGSLLEYVTAVAWSPDGLLAASSAAGEVVVWQDGNLVSLLPAGVASIDCLAFSSDGKFLAAGGQDGKVRIWSTIPTFKRGRKQEQEVKLIASLDNAPSWVDKLAWSPTCNHLAFSLGRYVQIWDADTKTVITTLPFANSSVLDLAWRPNGESIAIAGNGGVKVWSTIDWDDDPYLIDMPSASIVTAWSGDSKYIASGNFDNTITVLEYGSPHPWVMRGFPGKISNLTWSQRGSSNAPLLAASSMEGIAVWKKEADDKDGWNARVLTLHPTSSSPTNEVLPKSPPKRNEMRKKKENYFDGVRMKGNFRRLLWFQLNHSHEATLHENGQVQKIHLCTNEPEKRAFII